MRWLVIVLLVSVAALLLASGGLAHHIWRERKKRHPQQTGPGKTDDTETEEAP